MAVFDWPARADTTTGQSHRNVAGQDRPVVGDHIKEIEPAMLGGRFEIGRKGPARAVFRTQKLAEALGLTRKLQMPGSSSTTRTAACASHGPNSARPDGSAALRFYLIVFPPVAPAVHRRQASGLPISRRSSASARRMP
ncbi:hypothetical protein NN6n1_00160 [Shinella zoogloeoides]